MDNVVISGLQLSEKHIFQVIYNTNSWTASQLRLHFVLLVMFACTVASFNVFIASGIPCRADCIQNVKIDFLQPRSTTGFDGYA